MLGYLEQAIRSPSCDVFLTVSVGEDPRQLPAVVTRVWCQLDGPWNEEAFLRELLKTLDQDAQGSGARLARVEVKKHYENWGADTGGIEVLLYLGGVVGETVLGAALGQALRVGLHRFSNLGGYERIGSLEAARERAAYRVAIAYPEEARQLRMESEGSLPQGDGWVIGLLGSVANYSVEVFRSGTTLVTAHFHEPFRL